LDNFELNFFKTVQKFLILSKSIDFYEKFDKITIEVPKMVYREAFMQLSIIFTCFRVKMDQSQPAFFFGTEEVTFYD
jgi:hypothetical protein